MKEKPKEVPIKKIFFGNDFQKFILVTYIGKVEFYKVENSKPVKLNTDNKQIVETLEKYIRIFCKEAEETDDLKEIFENLINKKLLITCLGIIKK